MNTPAKNPATKGCVLESLQSEPCSSELRAELQSRPRCYNWMLDNPPGEDVSGEEAILWAIEALREAVKCPYFIKGLAAGPDSPEGACVAHTVIRVAEGGVTATGDKGNTVVTASLALTMMDALQARVLHTIRQTAQPGEPTKPPFSMTDAQADRVRAKVLEFFDAEVDRVRATIPEKAEKCSSCDKNDCPIDSAGPERLHTDESLRRFAEKLDDKSAGELVDLLSRIVGCEDSCDKKECPAHPASKSRAPASDEHSKIAELRSRVVHDLWTTLYPEKALEVLRSNVGVDRIVPWEELPAWARGGWVAGDREWVALSDLQRCGSSKRGDLVMVVDGLIKGATDAKKIQH